MTSLARIRTLSAVSLGILGILWLATAHSTDSPEENRRNAPGVPVIVELFTSQGCSSCPAADAFLNDLANNQPVDGLHIIPLSLHVDYWDDMGWKDSFSHRRHSIRQQLYASVIGDKRIYTPQMIINGRSAFTGSDTATAMQALRLYGTAAKLPVHVYLKDDRRAVIRVAGVNMLPRPIMGHVVLALTEDGLETEILRGENRGRSLSNVGVVRNIGIVGTVSLGPGADRAGFSREVELDLQPGWNPEHMHVVVFVQDIEKMRVLGATARPLSTPVKKR